VKAILSTARRHLPSETLAWLKRHWGSLRDQLESVLVENLCDWERTRIYSVGSYGNLYVNLRGREPQGQVAPGQDYERLLRDVADYLLALRDPEDGQTVVESVWRREEIYLGPALSRAPDLILGWRDYAYECRHHLGSGSSSVFADTIRLNEVVTTPITGCHRPDGVLLAYGAGVRPGLIHGASVTDVAPTVLHAFGLPVPPEMDGHALEALFDQPEPGFPMARYALPSPMHGRGAGSEGL
jgi:predicted AlkP superfamily phosphohydrolase/phosphomutase